MSKLLNEFDLIKKYFLPLVKPGGPALSLNSDTAQFSPTIGFDLVFTKDMMVEGVHFLSSVSPKNLAKKLLRVNLSDLAAAGAKPIGYLLGLGGTKNVDEKWLSAFSAGLAEDQEKFDISLWGGDTVKTPGPLVLSLTAIGEVPTGKGLSRVGAKVGEAIYCTGVIGDGVLGLMAAKGELSNDYSPLSLVSRLEQPNPRLEVGQKLVGLASAMADVSDGLLADLGHIARASDVAFEINQSSVPFSPNGEKFVEQKSHGFETLVSGGDDYELIFTAPKELHKIIIDISNQTGIAINLIGRVCLGEGIKVLDENGIEIILSKKGFKHF